MNSSRCVLRAAALRGQWSAASCRHFSAARSLAYNAYSLPNSPNPPSRTGATAPPTSDGVPDASITRQDPLPRVHETRPPMSEKAMPAPPAAAASPSSSTAPISSGQNETAAPTNAPSTSRSQTSTKPKASARPRSQLRAPRKAAMTLTPTAVERLRSLLDSPDPKLIKVGVRNRGCSGLAYHLEYVEKPGKFDEMVEQDGVQVVIDSKALFSIIGSEMDWAEDKLNQRFTFRNPNIKEECGCGESFMVT